MDCAISPTEHRRIVLFALAPYQLTAVSPSFAAQNYEDDNDMMQSSLEEDSENAQDLVTEDEYKLGMCVVRNQMGCVRNV